MNKVIFFASLLATIPSIALTEPAIDNIGPSLSIGKSITINGLNFGSNGPNIILYDEFTGRPGDIVSLGATLGSWTGSAHSPSYIQDTEKNTALLSVDGTTSRQMNVTFPGTQEVFISYKVKIPPGFHFPNTAANGDFAPDSAWKLAWIMDGPDSSPDDDDICLPTWPNGTYFQIAGNDTGIKLKSVPAGPEVGRPSTNTNWFSFNGWNRISVYMKAAVDPINDPGTIMFQGMSIEYGIHTFNFTDRTLFDGDDNSGDDNVSEWNYFAISGWHRYGVTNAAYDSTTRAIYDDIYIATGNNAAARVEIGNNEVYENCTKLAIATPEKWENTSITAKINPGDFTTGDMVYVFVVDADNKPSLGHGPFALSAPMIKRLQ